MRNNTEQSNIRVISHRKREKREWDRKILEEIVAEKFSNLLKHKLTV